MLARGPTPRSSIRLCCPGHVTRLPPPPTLPRPPARVGFPVVAVVMPIVAAVIIGLLTGSAFVLVFAVLSPVIALATMLDGRRVARRHRLEEAARFDRECAAYAEAIDAAHAAEAQADGRELSSFVRIGVGPRTSAVAPEAPLISGSSEPEKRLDSLLQRARVNPARPLLLPHGEVVVAGQGRAAEAMAARLDLEPGVHVVRASGESPGAAVGGAVGGAVGRSHTDAPAALPRSTVTVHSALRVELVTPGGATYSGRPELSSALELDSRAADVRDRGTTLPTMELWRDLPEPARVAAADVDTVPIGRCSDGVATIDLVTEGPHVLVGGTTGSGKSEFLRTLALGWAAVQSPARLQLLFVDFKGGATFADLMALPHAAGLVTDLDPLVAERTLTGLRAELRRRERLLVELGVRDAGQEPERIPRLVVLIDEFAALIDAFPELHAAFADISARGRSLGVHLVLGTQHPAAAVRDAVAANCALRVAFRLPSSAATAFIGPSGRDLAAVPAGRALVVGADRERVVQVAVIDDADIVAVAERWQSHPVGPQPWLPPLPSRVAAADLEHESLSFSPGQPARASGSIAFGMLDDPGELRRGIALWNPVRDGALAVIGCSGSGRTSALAALAEAAAAEGRAVCVLPGTVPAAWERLVSIAAPALDGPAAGCLLVADDLDLLVAEAAERGPELLALWDSAVRAVRSGGGGAAASLGPASASRAIVGARFAARLLLRALDADDHALAGAPRGLYDRAAPPGRGWWLDRQVQVVEPRGGLVVESGVAEVWHPPLDGDIVVVAASRERAVVVLRDAFPKKTIVGVPALGESEPPSSIAIDARGRVIVADADEWQASWSVLASLRRRCPVLAIGVSAGELRSLLGVRSPPPPIAVEQGECWLIEPGGSPPRRVGLPLASGPVPKPATGASG